MPCVTRTLFGLKTSQRNQDFRGALWRILPMLILCILATIGPDRAQAQNSAACPTGWHQQLGYGHPYLPCLMAIPQLDQVRIHQLTDSTGFRLGNASLNPQAPYGLSASAWLTLSDAELLAWFLKPERTNQIARGVNTGDPLAIGPFVLLAKFAATYGSPPIANEAETARQALRLAFPLCADHLSQECRAISERLKAELLLAGFGGPFEVASGTDLTVEQFAQAATLSAGTDRFPRAKWAAFSYDPIPTSSITNGDAIVQNLSAAGLIVASHQGERSIIRRRRPGQQAWDVASPSGPIDEWGLSESDWLILSGTAMLLKARIWERPDLGARAAQGDLKALILILTWWQYEPHLSALCETRWGIGLIVKSEQAEIIYNPRPQDCTIPREQANFFAQAEASGFFKNGRWNTDSAYTNDTFRRLTEGNIPLGWYMARFFITPQMFNSQRPVFALNGSLARLIGTTAIQSSSVEKVSIACALTFAAHEAGLALATRTLRGSCNPGALARYAGYTQLDDVDAWNTILARTFQRGDPLSGIALVNRMATKLDWEAIVAINRQIADMGYIWFFEGNWGSGIESSDANRLWRTQTPNDAIEIVKTWFMNRGYSEQESLRAAQQNRRLEFERIETIARNGDFVEQQGHLPNVTTVQGVILREMKYVNDRNNPWVMLTDAMGVRGAVFNDRIDPVDGTFTQSGRGGSAVFTLRVVGLECRWIDASRVSTRCRYELGYGVDFGGGPFSVSQGMRWTDKETTFTWRNGMWVSEQIRQEALAGMANAPISRTQPASPDPNAALCRSLRSGVVAAGGNSTSQALSPSTWGC